MATPRRDNCLYLLLISTFAVLCCMHLCNASMSPYAYQPKILVQNGHLEFVGAEGRNISLRTSVGGYVNLNGDNLVHLVAAAKEASRIVENIKASGLTSLQDSINSLQGNVDGPQGLGQRVALLEGQFANLSSSGGNNVRPNLSYRLMNRRFFRLSRRVNQLFTQVRELQTLLTTNECSSSPCMNGGTCEDIYNGFLCRCLPNWEGDLCQSDVNECTRFAGTDLGCQNGATCTNKPGSYECHCPSGFFGVHCTQRGDNCSSASTQELCGHGFCIPQNKGMRGYTCICEQGWTTENSRDPACTHDINECLSYKPACSHDPAVPCINVPGSFHCGACPQGYSGNGYYCADIDECLVNNGGCSLNPYVPCINTRGSRTCGSCPPGYQGDGTRCMFTGVCQINNGGCHPMARCIENPRISQSYVECLCPSGFTGNGIGPAGCQQMSGGGGAVIVGDPCASQPCLNGGTCFSLRFSSVSCRCPIGFIGLRCEIRVNPCQSNPCNNGGTCSPFVNGTGFSCQCTRDYTGEYCQTQQQACGGTLSGLSGTLQFPSAGNSKYQHSTNCAWLLVTNNTKVLNVTFTKFNLEVSSSCQFDWLQIHDGRGAGEHIIGRFCGNTLPKGGNIVSTHNTLYFWFRSDHSVSQDGFEFSWNSIDPVCGGRIERDSHGTVQSPGSPGKYPANRDCYWSLIVPFGQRIQIHFFTLQIEAHPNCSHDYLEVRDGLQTSSPLLGTYCNSTVPPPIVTSGSTAMLYFHSDNYVTDYGFQLTFSAVPATPGCGGLWTTLSGELSSPNHPDTYRHNINCEWRIRLPIGDRIKITFLTFSLEDSRSCNFDYLELRDGENENSPLIARLCGNTVPRPYQSSANVMFLQFKSDESIAQGGFRLKYETLCGGQFTELSGIIHSPFYPEPYPGSKECIYHISIPPANAIQLQFLDFDLEHSGQCRFDYIQIRDGDDDNSTLIGTYCGSEDKAPSKIISTFNHLWLKFKTDSSIHQRGFRANYSSIDLTCGGILTGQTGTLVSPQHPSEYPPNLDCVWIINGDPGTVVQIVWLTFHLEEQSECMLDYLNIYDGKDANEESLIRKLCGSSLPPVFRTSKNSMRIVFHTDFSVSHDGFSAQYTILDASKVCGGTYFTATGFISTPNYPNSYPDLRDCTWVINVPTGQQIMLNVTDFKLEDSSLCHFDYLEIRNGGYETSPLVGKFCGIKIPKAIPSMSNQLYLRFVSDSSHSESGFKIFWDGTTTGCGGRLTSPSGSIVSPNYPQNYGRFAECFWKISISKGSVIQLVIVDLNLEEHSSCEFDFIEIRDGIDSTGKLLGKYCNENHALHMTSTKNNMWIKFRSDGSNEGRGFHLRYTSVCNTELKGYRGVLESLNFPETYPLHIDCTWIIVAPLGNNLNISFSHFELEQSNSEECPFDYLEISEGAGKNSPSKSFGKYCGNQLPNPIASELGHVFVHFVTDSSESYKGFRLEWTINGCGGFYEHPFGSFTTPGYPNSYPLSTICEWHIRVGWGESIELTINSFDMESSPKCIFDHIRIYGGPDETSPMLGEICDKRTKPSVFTSSGNNMLVKFQSDSSFTGKGLMASYRSVPSNCGGRFISTFGSIHSRNYPNNYVDKDDCYWSIEVDKNHIIQLVFLDFDVEAHNNCSADYVNVFDGDTEEHPLLLNHCGRDLPTPPVVYSTGNKMLIRMKTDGSITSKGFLANYTLHCGAHIKAEDFGEISVSFNQFTHIYNRNNINCSWIIEGPRPDDHVTLTIGHIDLNPSYAFYSEECSNLFLEVRDGMDSSSPLIGKYCNSRVPPHITSTGSSLFVHFFSSYSGFLGNFKAFYSTLESGKCHLMINKLLYSMNPSSMLIACGGELTSEHGAFTTPGLPGTYPPNAECVWTIKTSPGNRAVISFRSFNLEASDNCDRDYVEIREGDSGGSLIGVYCGDTIPSNITASKKFWIKFRSDEDGTGQGFVADYSMLHGNEIVGTQGQIASPLYPNLSIREGTYQWRITVELGKVISITFEEFSLIIITEDCSRYYLAIFDGYDESAPSLYRGCGNTIPSPVTSSYNVVYIVWHSPGFGSWFLLNWMQLQRTQISTNVPESTRPTIPGCGGYIFVSKNMTQFTSPGYPYGYFRNLDCEWIFETDESSHLVFTISDMNLQNYPVINYCIFDYVEVFNGVNNHQDWRHLKTFCLENSTNEQPLHGSNIMKVVFHTNYFRNGTGFSAIMNSACGGSLFGSSGVIDAINITKYIGDVQMPSGTCEWNITVRRGRKVSVEFDVFDLSFNNDEFCSNSYVLFKNGGSSTSPILGSGKYCGNTIPQIPETVGNLMYIKYNAHNGIKGFRLRFMEKSLSCGGQVMLSTGAESHVFSSPNFPQIPPPHIECEWVFLAPGGETINLDFLDRFDLTRSPGCTQDYVEVRDGGTQNSPLIKRLCENMPGTLSTTGNILYVKFFTDVTDPRNGFKAKASIAKCGGIIRSSRGFITSPKYPLPYDSNLLCTWTIVSPAGHSVKITFNDIDLPLDRNCSNTDHITISENVVAVKNDLQLATTRQTYVTPHPFHWIEDSYEDMSSEEEETNSGEMANKKRILANLCGSSTPEVIDGSYNELHITFHSGSNNHNFKGFNLRFEISRDQCGGQLEGAPSGVIESPFYPNANLHNRLCVWFVSVPQGRRIRVEFSDLDLGGDRINCFQRLSFQNGRGFSLIRNFCGGEASEPVETSSNGMLVYFFLRHPSTHRGFRLSYSSDLPTVCEGDMSSSAGIITSPKVADNSPFSCEWEHKDNSSSNFTFAINLSHFQVGSFHQGRCILLNSKLSIYTGNGLELASFCGSYDTPQIVATPYEVTKVVANIEPLNQNKDNQSRIRNFTLEYSTHQCGGILVGPHEVITSPNFPQQYPANTECAWALIYPDGQQIKLKFTDMDLEVDCNNDFVLVRNGRTPESPLIGKYCGNVIPPEIISQSNYLWIWFHSNLANQLGGFKITTEPVVGGCGGISHSLTGEIFSPNYPKQYPNNAECQWEINVDDGYRIGLMFTGRFQLEEGENCNKDSVEVLNYSNESWASLGKVCGRNLPTYFNSSGTQMKVIFRSNEAVPGDGFLAQWNSNCGGILTKKKGHIISPGYPQSYSNNLKCEYTISAPGEYIRAEFLDFLLEEGSDHCLFDNVTIYLVDRRGRAASSHSVMGPYCGTDKPPPVRSIDLIRIVFETDGWINRKGFIINYEVESCGGYFNQPGIISSPTHSDKYYAQPNCTWVIEAPVNKVVLLVFEIFNLERSGTCVYDWVSIYDGPLIDPNKRLARFCGNLNNEPPVAKSTTRNMVVQFSADFSVSFEGFRAAFLFTYGEQSGCGGTKVLSPSSSVFSLRSPDIERNDNLYEPFLDCHWLLTGPPEQRISLEFKSMDLTPCNITSNSSSALHSCNCDFIEIRDGAGPFSELIGKYCGSDIPPLITSSYHQLWFRFVSDGFGNGHGFQVDVKGVESPCGHQNVLPVTNVTKYLTSPGYPRNYPNNIRCRWLLTSEEHYRFDIHFAEMELEDSNNCENDWLEIYDRYISGDITEGFGSSLVYNGKVETEVTYMSGRSPVMKSKFCGVGHPSDFYSGTNNVEISFVTNSENTSRGFKLAYQFEGCNRNFTREQGRILNGRAALSSECFISIQAQPNHTISLYFNEFYFTNSEGCSTSGMEIHDGPTDSSPILTKLCGHRLPDSIYSTSSALSIRLWFSRHRMSERYDITYTTTDKGIGCGGRIFNYGGRFTSPWFPASVNNSSSCRWQVMVPEGSFVALDFEVFDLGIRRSCETDYLDIFDVDKSTNAEIFRAKYCGMDNPAKFQGSSNMVIVQYVTSINNLGRGWAIRFTAIKPGSILPRM